jgi:hypothetical protein
MLNVVNTVIHLADCGIYCGACNGRWWCHASPCNLLGKGTCYNLNFDKYFQGWLSIVCLMDKPVSLSLFSQRGNVAKVYEWSQLLILKLILLL